MTGSRRLIVDDLELAGGKTRRDRPTPSGSVEVYTTALQRAIAAEATDIGEPVTGIAVAIAETLLAGFKEIDRLHDDRG